MSDLGAVAPAFVEMAHRIVGSVGATTGVDGRPATRVLHPFWEFDGDELTGWLLTSPLSPKAAHLEATPSISFTYWQPNQDTCTADCDAVWELSPEERAAGWERLKNAPAPVGYDPAIIPGWDTPESPDFGVVRLIPTWLRVMPGAVMLEGRIDDLLTWRR